MITRGLPKSEDDFKLDTESLNKPPEEVFDILSKLGEGSYGAVFQALHKDSGRILAIKQVPVDTDLQEIIKEISIMQQCDSPYVVKYYGSYFKNTDLWIVMEYCGAGSVSDIMRLRKKPLTEAEIASVLRDTLRGLQYLHERRKIHRDVKAGNILLNIEGHAKLADFGVAGQLTDTMAKRNTMIGTPFWMAPEVIEEIGYDCKADIWSLGITALELAEEKPPYADIHPMRAIFMIPTKPPPSFRKPDLWSAAFIDFVSCCLVKNPEERASATQLLEHPFIQNAPGVEILADIIEEARHIRADRQRYSSSSEESTPDGSSLGGADEADPIAAGGTLVPDSQTLVSTKDEGTLLPSQMPKKQADDLNAYGDSDKTMNTLESEVRTMIINDETMRSDKPLKTDPNQAGSEQNGAEQQPAVERPYFLDQIPSANAGDNVNGTSGPVFNQDSSASPYVNVPAGWNQQVDDGNFDFIRFLGVDEIREKLGMLDAEMDKEIDELRRRYLTKRQPILDAIEGKKAKLTNF